MSFVVGINLLQVANAVVTEAGDRRLRLLQESCFMIADIHSGMASFAKYI
jgi:hypothetical protein